MSTQPASTVYLSPEGLTATRQRAREIEAALELIRREKLTAYTGSGDGWHDNPFFNKLEQDERSTAAMLAEVKDQLARAVVFTPRGRPTDAVRIGSIVEVARWEVGAEPVHEVWEIGCFNDSDKLLRRIGYNTPLAAAIVGKEEGGTGTFRQGRPGRAAVEVEVEVVALHEDWPADAGRAAG